ncbi:glycoside hydrolase [Rhypophila sp. PSN 637]
MGAQLPSELAGQAAAVLIYSFVCLAAGSFMLWLVVSHNEWKSYIAIMATLMNLSSISSISQQIHTIHKWRDIRVAQHAYLVEHVGNPEINVTGGSVGADLVLFYIQYYTYTANSMLVFFWAIELAYSIFQLQKFNLHNKNGGLIAKASGIIFPAILMGILRLEAVQKNLIAFMFLANGVMAVSMTGAFVLLAVLIKYIHAKRSLVSFQVRYGQRSREPTGGSNSYPRTHTKSIYDNWLVVRFTIAFVALGLFQLVVFLFEMRAMGTNTPENVPPEPDLSIEKAKGDLALFVPGISAGLLLYVVFGTTAHFRAYTAKVLFSTWLREKLARSKDDQPGPYTGPPSVPPKEFPYGNQYEPPGPRLQQQQSQQSHTISINDDDSYDDDIEQHKRSKSQAHRVQIRQHPRNNPSQHKIEEEEISGGSRQSLSWYGSRPSDIERGYSEFSPIDSTNDQCHGTIPLQYIEPKPRQPAVLSNKSNDDEWPILAAIPTPLAPRPRSRSEDRLS